MSDFVLLPVAAVIAGDRVEPGVSRSSRCRRIAGGCWRRRRLSRWRPIPRRRPPIAVRNCRLAKSATVAANHRPPASLVGGDFGIADMTGCVCRGSRRRSRSWSRKLAPWVTPERIARDGAAMVCNLYPDQHDCTVGLKTGDGQSYRPQPAAAPPRVHDHAQLFGYSGQARTLFDHRRAAAAVIAQ